MTPKINKLLLSMDEHNWCRMLVCFTPGLVLGKLVSPLGVPLLNTAANVVLVAGFAIYFFWPRLRPHQDTDELDMDGVKLVEQSVASHPPASPGRASGAVSKMGGEYSAMMKELIDLCGGITDKALELINTELAIDSSLIYTEALERALRRARHLGIAA